MQLIQLRLCQVLLMATLLCLPEGITAGCYDWKLKDRTDVCCIQCRPGNRLVEQCGPDPTTLCKPCESNTYTVEPLSSYCKRCTQCIDPMVQMMACNGSADTVCGCKPGFLCGNPACAHCVQECTKGQEPTKQWTCRKCPEGTFNDQVHSTCKPWSKSCPKGEQIIARGNELQDITCGRIPEFNPVTLPAPSEEVTTLKTTTGLKADNILLYILIGCFGCFLASMLPFILLLRLKLKRAKNKGKTISEHPNKDTPTQGELTIMMVEHDEACSFHQPEQEQGASSESINTQDSETKLIL